MLDPEPAADDDCALYHSKSDRVRTLDFCGPPPWLADAATDVTEAGCRDEPGYWHCTVTRSESIRSQRILVAVVTVEIGYIYN